MGRNGTTSPRSGFVASAVQGERRIEAGLEFARHGGRDPLLTLLRDLGKRGANALQALYLYESNVPEPARSPINVLEFEQELRRKLPYKRVAEIITYELHQARARLEDELDDWEAANAHDLLQRWEKALGDSRRPWEKRSREGQAAFVRMRVLRYREQGGQRGLPRDWKPQPYRGKLWRHPKELKLEEIVSAGQQAEVELAGLRERLRGA